MTNYQDSLWLFPRRETVSGQPETLDFHGGFIPQVAQGILERWSQPGDTVIDWFFGSGTSGYVAQNMNRFLVGLDIRAINRPGLDPRYVQTGVGDSSSPDGLNLAEGLLSNFSLPGHPTRRDVLIKAGRPLAGFAPSLAILHPPYANIIGFNGGPNDLSALTPEAFLSAFKRVAENTWAILPQRGWAALVIGDMYFKSEHYPLGFLTAEVMRGIGFKQKAIVVKDIQNNQAAEKSAALKAWRRNAHGTVKFRHEYIFAFRKG